jgi:hypothetical protein
VRIIRFISNLSPLIILIFLFSCESESKEEEKSGFYIEISDGTLITEGDIMYYDSTSCILFLKNPVYFSYKESERWNLLENEFVVFVDGDTIYRGMIYPYYYLTNAAPLSPFIVDRDVYELDRSVLEIKFTGFGNDLRNDSRIIQALNNSGLLYSGISFTIDRIEIFDLFPYDSVRCEFTIYNPDPVNYYILDPQKMGETYFDLYNGGLIFTRHETGYETGFEGIYHSEYGTITEEDFMILPANSSVSMAFSSTNYLISFSGIYSCTFHLRFRSSNIDLDQPQGRIWIGNVRSGLDNIVFEAQHE